MRFTLTAVLLACAATLVAAAPAPNAQPNPEPAILDRGDGGDPGSF